MNLEKYARATALTPFMLIPSVTLAEAVPRDATTQAFREAIPNIPGKSINAIA
jgi:hypothetical protein